MKKIIQVLLSTLLILCASIPIYADGSLTMWRLYNPNSGEHFYTSSAGERDSVYNAGWNIEGYGWISPSYSNTPVYRVYNPNVGDHHYTSSLGEKNYLVSVGWNYEGIAWYATDGNSGIPIYREYNPNARTGAHNFTTSRAEHDMLVSAGWKDEGIAFYVLGAGSSEGSRTHETMVYVYSIRSTVFHKSNCPSVTNMNSGNKRTSTSRDELLSKGLTPCRNCNP